MPLFFCPYTGAVVTERLMREQSLHGRQSKAKEIEIKEGGILEQRQWVAEAPA
jgi:hypothetical protein